MTSSVEVLDILPWRDISNKAWANAFNESIKSGFVYAPYVPLIITPSFGIEELQTQLEFDFED